MVQASVRRRLFGLFCVLVGTFVALACGWRAFEHGRSESIQESQGRDVDALIASILDLRRRAYVNFCRDYTFWDEMVEFAATGDRAWAELNLDPAAETFDVEGVYVFDMTGKQVYGLPDTVAQRVAELPLNPSRFHGVFGSDTLVHFFARQGSILLEVHGATIHAGDDPERTGTRHGYFFAVKRWDAEYLAGLRPLTECTVRVAWPADHLVASPHRRDGRSDRVGIAVNRELVGPDGEKVAVLVFHRALPALDQVAIATDRALTLVVGFALLALAALAFGLHRYVDAPLKALTASLRAEDPRPLGALTAASHEFGHLARLMREFFDQRAAMLEEVERRRASENELARSCRRNDDATRSRMQMLAHVSHEIRSPLNGVIGMVDLLLDTSLDAQQREFVGTIQGSSHALLEVLNEVLDLAKLEEGKVVLEEIDFDLRATVEDVVALFAAQAQGKRLEIAAIVPAECVTSLRGDPGRMRQILINLVSNAVKYTEKGEVVLEVECIDSNDDRPRFALRVRDTGVGVPGDRQRAIFDAYEQSTASDARCFGGTGLGLTISRHLAHLLGGKLSVESEPGRGSTFTLEVTFRRGSFDADEFGLGDGRLRALVLAQSPTTRRSLCEQIRAIGGAVVECEDVPALQNALRIAAPAGCETCVIVEHSAADGDLSTFARRVQRELEGSRARLCIVALLGDVVGRSKGRRVDEAQVVSRPVSTARLRAALLRDVGGASAVPPASRGERSDPVALAGLRVLIAESYPPTARILMEHARDIGVDAVLAADGKAALDALTGERFDLAIVDLRLTVIDGQDVARRVRGSERSAGRERVPIVGLNAAENERERWSRSGIDDAVAMPVTRESLLKAILRNALPRASAAT